MVGFTLTNGFTYGNGRGVYCESNAVLTNCVLSGNSAPYGYGGGAYGGTLNNCILSGDSASYGGGAYGGTLNNCILTGNSATVGGGAFASTLTNCVLSENSGWNGGGAYGGTLNNCTLTGNLRGPPQPSRRLSSHPASGKNYEQKTCRNSSWGFCLALVRGNSKTDAVEGDTAHGRSHYLRRLGI